MRYVVEEVEAVASVFSTLVIEGVTKGSSEGAADVEAGRREVRANALAKREEREISTRAVTAREAVAGSVDCAASGTKEDERESCSSVAAPSKS